MELLPMCLVLLFVTSSEAVEVVDLTHDLGPTSIYWPGNPSFQFTILSRGNQSGSFWYESNSFFTPEHGGTHLDSPAHFGEGQWRVDDIPVSHLVGPAVVVDVKAKAAADPDYLMSVEDVQDWEKVYGRLPTKCIVIMNSDWNSRYPNASLVFNTPTPTNASTFHFPGIHPDLATFLTTQRDVIAVGVDTPSTDYGQSPTFDTHIIMARHNVLGLENLANLDSLPPRGSTVVIGIVKLVDGSGGPARILGLVGEGADIFGSQTCAGDRAAVVVFLVIWGVLLSGWWSIRW